MQLWLALHLFDYQTHLSYIQLDKHQHIPWELFLLVSHKGRQSSKILSTPGCTLTGQGTKTPRGESGRGARGGGGNPIKWQYSLDFIQPTCHWFASTVYGMFDGWSLIPQPSDSVLQQESGTLFLPDMVAYHLECSQSSKDDSPQHSSCNHMAALKR